MHFAILKRSDFSAIAIFGIRWVPLAITAFGGPESYFSLVIIACGAFGFIVPKDATGMEKIVTLSAEKLANFQRFPLEPFFEINPGIHSSAQLKHRKR